MLPYEPCELPISNLDYKMLLPLVGKANRELSRYDGLLQGIVNPEVLLSPLTTEEATLSSRLEGTQATIDDVYEHEAGIEKSEEQVKDIQEITNYRAALRSGQFYLEQYPITLPFVRELHKILLSSVRGKDKSPGEVRVIQNFIGAPGSKIEDATFVPAAPVDLPKHLYAWQKYLSGDDIDVLIQTAIMHAQFELLHPFKDGNGRIGRLLIPLFLFQKKALSKPMFYLSSYLEANKDEYHSALNGISKREDWNGWIAFFLLAVTEQAKINIEKVKKIKDLYEEMKLKIPENTHSQFASLVLDQIFRRPIFRTTDFISESGIKKPSAMTIIRDLKSSGILDELISGAGRRPAVLWFQSLIKITEGK